MPYCIDDLRHTFSAWTASRAASRGVAGLGNESTFEIMEGSGLSRLIISPLNLPEPHHIDIEHQVWRERVIGEAATHNVVATHGIAAKLINIYFKSAFVCGGYHEHERVRALHPPIDRKLLETLALRNVGGLAADWDTWRTIGWKSFNSTIYQDVIDAVRTVTNPLPMWSIEEHWNAF